MTLAVESIPVADPAAWRELRATLARFVAARVPAPDVEDVLHDVFLRVARGLPELRDGERLTAWMYQIARNAIADYHRRPRTERAAGDDGVAELADDRRDDDDARAACELAGVVRDFIARLPEPYREALELTDLQGTTQATVAAQLGLSLSGMKSRVQRARAQLRDMLDACCSIELDARGRIVECEPRGAPDVAPGCCRG